MSVDPWGDVVKRSTIVMTLVLSAMLTLGGIPQDAANDRGFQDLPEVPEVSQRALTQSLVEFGAEHPVIRRSDEGAL